MDGSTNATADRGFADCIDFVGQDSYDGQGAAYPAGSKIKLGYRHSSHTSKKWLTVLDGTDIVLQGGHQYLITAYFTPTTQGNCNIGGILGYVTEGNTWQTGSGTVLVDLTATSPTTNTNIGGFVVSNQNTFVWFIITVTKLN